jgi:5-methyltetrahydrofolate--homocysteine methyltransferase
METCATSPRGKVVAIGEDLPLVLIGERINPFGKGPVKEAMISGAMEVIRGEALGQVAAGADILIVSVAAFGIDEVRVLPEVTAAVLEVVDVPLCLESRNPEALERALKLGCGRPIISSVTGEEHVLATLLPLVKAYGTALVALASDGSGIPREAAGRLSIIRSILDRVDRFGIPREAILVDCVAESSAVNDKAALSTLETMGLVKRELGLNLVLGTSNVSFGLPGRSFVNGVFLSLALRAGLTCAIVNAAQMKPYAMAADLLMGRDPGARRFTAYFRKLKSLSPK